MMKFRLHFTMAWICSLIFLFSCTEQNRELPLTAPDQSTTTHSTETDKALSAAYEGQLPGGALYLITVPESWNGDLVVYAHGYVAASEPVAIPEDQLVLPDGTYIPDLVNDLGFAFATTSYRANGLVVPEAILDLQELVSAFNELLPDARFIYLIGASEGGLVTTKSIESGSVFSGGMATCGPIGSFREQINYVGDFRVVFDYFFPGIIPGSPVSIPQEVMDHWNDVYVPRIIASLSASPERAVQLIRVTNAPVDPEDLESIGETTLGVLWYNVFGTNDAREKLEGQPFDNRYRIYQGSLNDALLNAHVQRFSADARALENIQQYYETSGVLDYPIVTLHTRFDPIVPAWHARQYKQKIDNSGSWALYQHIPVNRYGHCNFEVNEVLAGFALLVFQVSGQELFPSVLASHNHAVLRQ